MRVIPVLAIVLSLGLSMMVLGGLGVNAYFGDSGEVGLQEEINETTEQDQSLDPDEGEDGGFLSFATGGASQMMEFLSMVVFLPSTLQSLGAPMVVARAIGHATQLVVAIGIIQILLQFNIR